MRSMAGRRVLPGLALLPLLAACDIPNFEGPQIQSPPPAFFMQNEAYQQRAMFGHLEPIHHDAWVETSDGFFSGIFINGYSGVLTPEDVFAAQDSARRYAATMVRFGEVEPIEIDGRQAWAWSEIRQGQAIGIDWIAYRAMIPYDTITYAVEFHGGEPGLKQRPDTLRTIVATFAIGKTTWNWPLIALLGGSLLLGVSMLRARAQEKRRRLQSIALKQIPKKDADDKAGAEGAPPASSSGIAPAPAATHAAATPPAAAPADGSIAAAVAAAAEAKAKGTPKPPTGPGKPPAG